MRCQERQNIRNGNLQCRLPTLLIVGLRERVDCSDNSERLVFTSVVQSFHCCQLHRLHFGNHIGRSITGNSCQQRGNQSDNASNLDAFDSQPLLTLPQKVVAAHRNGEDGSDNPCRGHCVQELIDGKGRQCHFKEAHHLVAHRVGIELTSHRILHPGVCHQNPPRRDGSTQAREPGRSEMEPCRHLLPSEEHHGNECRFHEERDDSLYSERSAEDVAHEPRIVAPVCSELKLENDSRSHAHSEIDTEEFLPELCRIPPEGFLRAIVAGFHDSHDNRKSECQGNEQPVIDCSQRKLGARPINHPGIYI